MQAITPNGAFAYVANYFGDNVSVINTATNAVVGSPIAVGDYPYGVAITPDGAFAYVTNNNEERKTLDDTVSVIDTATNAVSATIPVGAFPRSVAICPAAVAPPAVVLKFTG